MSFRPLTAGDWIALVSEEIVPAYECSGQLPERFKEHAIWVGKRLMAERWTYEQTRWCIREVTRTEVRFGNLMAMMNRANAGTRDRDGNSTGGWRNSNEYRRVCDRERNETERRECVTALRDGRPIAECGMLARCVECEVWIDKKIDRAGEMQRAGGE